MKPEYILCEDCGESRKLSPYGKGNTKYCTPCVKARQKALSRQSYQKYGRAAHQKAKKANNLCTACGIRPKGHGMRFLCLVSFGNSDSETIYTANNKAMREARSYSGI